MKIKNRILLGPASMLLGIGVLGSSMASAHKSFFYWERPHWATVPKASTYI
ncbi:hypothetical protein HCC74_08270 [Lentilactobacillus parabuchneri]|uniref:Uncharacterized protein n=1 Tax=Lentilactobacillus parabuchneri DSM 5707 = NBRC 107865 TaxID=1423784 RepID=A0A0R1YY20_9LACO|nr:hypothetical protein [Lentilactobacillus parabuchneri]KRM47536.1 hypothetical protein FC51_GL000008 [Lentilactobacillus parabuchneri DSM 5707 = NBRC 107865]KRN77888.1 hypothetical protein IV42_GL002387 [Lentilactobacillus parabuchneri]MBW0221610.1 hypothetical protein [Lentilactobacillus parabuchneri]MBW0245165.1 hypothetical protein [Lentilactobacillus parabuchneri]MBW0263244.1 hypothetical protein [Lentilactobacillus parabuchneri]